MIAEKNVGKAFLLLFFIVFSFIAGAQQRGGNESTGGIIVTGKTGMSSLITEVYRDFSGAVTEFNNRPGMHAGIELSRFFTSSLEAGGGISYSHLRGQTHSTVFSATGFHYRTKEPFEGPVQYNNRLYGPEVFARYHFNRKEQNLNGFNFFVKAGAGVLFHESELFYSDRTEDEIIFGKGYAEQKRTTISNGVFVLGGGLNYNISKTVSLKVAADINVVGYDFMDVMHNFTSAGDRQEVFGLFTDLTAGIAIKLKGNDKPASTNRPGTSSGSHLPFAP